MAFSDFTYHTRIIEKTIGWIVTNLLVIQQGVPAALSFSMVPTAAILIDADRVICSMCLRGQLFWKLYKLQNFAIFVIELV